MTEASPSTNASALPDAIIPPAELDYHIQSVQPQHLADIGSAGWLRSHETVLKLLQQAHIEMSTDQEEIVADLIIQHDKLPVLVHEIYTVLIWRTKVLPRLLAIEAQPTATFALYTVLFHEATALSLIEATLFHQSGCQALNETAIDLIDYCAQAVVQLIGLSAAEQDTAENDDEYDENTVKSHAIADIPNTADELNRQQRDLAFRIGMRCLSTLCYIVDKLDMLSLSAATRLVRTHDIPCVLSEVLHTAPWRRRRRQRTEKFYDNQWRPVHGDAILLVTKVEAQTWLCMRQLLFNTTVSRNYAITEFRQRELAKCQGLMNELLLDQMPPLAEFKHYLCTLQVTGGPQRDTLQQQVLLEEMPLVRERIVGGAKRLGGWQRIVELQAQVFLHKDAEQVQQMAQQLNETYGADVWERIEGRHSGTDADAAAADHADGSSTLHECLQCQQAAVKKCFQCKRAYYCCRECQVKDWPRHRVDCRRT